jgi:hypothetical protein
VAWLTKSAINLSFSNLVPQLKSLRLDELRGTTVQPEFIAPHCH